jgi:vacuolar-type H+-ATPase subunit E/Vma4
MQELIKVNNNLTLLMKKKKALQSFIKSEEDRLEGIDPRERAYLLLYDEEFIKLHHRKRKIKEIGQIMGYSERQVNRLLQIKKED